MHLIYIDESKDEKKCVYSGLAIPANRWHSCLEAIKDFRHDIKRTDGISVHTEFHAWKFVSGRGNIAESVVTMGRRCQIFKQMLQLATVLPGIRLFNSVFPTKADETAFQALMQGINRTLERWNNYALLICDRGNEVIYTRLVRHMQISKNGATNRIIEDPFFKSSDQSYFIQLSDFCAYALLRQERPIASKTKYGLDQAFNLLEPISEVIVRSEA